MSRANACTVASELNSIVLSSESRHELIAIDTKMKLAIIAKNFILILKDSVYLQVAKIGTFFSINSFIGKFYIKL